MKRSPSTPKDTAAVACVIELCQWFERNKAHWTVIISRPGREGTYSKTWSAPSSQLDENQAVDLCTWVQQTAWNALLAWNGVHMSLPS